ncbi:MAG: hypothetical protein Q7J34_11745 [Bacteroidales bacterium]|nr:hypothetical protein [Bacteroidales bacterium]
MFKRIGILATLCFLLQMQSIASIVILNGLSQMKTASVGETYTGFIEIQNAGSVAKTVRIYQTDYSFDYHGNAFYKEDLASPRTNAHWIEFSPKQTSLGAGEIMQVRYKVKVPTNDSLTGSFWSLFMVEEIIPPDPNAKKQLAITTTMRYAIQIVTNIGTTGISSLKKIQQSVSNEEAGNYLHLDIENDGERLLTLKFSMQVFNKEGIRVLDTEHPSRKLYPASSLRFDFLLNGLQSGVYSAVCYADGGEDEIFGFEIDFTIP